MELTPGTRVVTTVGPATIIRVCEREVHLRPDKYHSLTLVKTPAEVVELLQETS